MARVNSVEDADRSMGSRATQTPALPLTGYSRGYSGCHR